MKPFRQMDQCCLITGFDEEPEMYMDIVPTMATITRGGHKYHRMPASWGEHDGKTSALYLRDDYGDRLKVQLGIRKQEDVKCEPPPVRVAAKASTGHE